MFKNWFRHICFRVNLSGFTKTAVHMRNVVSLQLVPEQYSYFHNQVNLLQISEQQVAIKFFFLSKRFFIRHFDLSSGLKGFKIICGVYR